MLFYLNSVSPYNSHQEYIIERESIQQHYKAGDMEEFTIDVESLIRTPGIIPFCTIIYLSVHGVHFIVIIVVYYHRHMGNN